MNSFTHLVNWLDKLNIDFGNIHLSFLYVIQAGIVVCLIVAVAYLITCYIEKKVYNVQSLSDNTKTAINRINKIIIIVLVIFTVLPTIGINISVLSVFGGAIGVGLGIGLQRIASNFVSGFIILIDKSIKIGDRLVIGEHVGDVTKITARYVLLRSLTGSEIIIPNEKFISDIVVNQSYSDTKILLEISIAVVHNTNLALALQLMLDAVDSRYFDNVSFINEPTSAIKNCTDVGVNLSLYVWIMDPRNGTNSTRTKIYMHIIDLFYKNKIEMALSNQDIKITNEYNNRA